MKVGDFLAPGACAKCRAAPPPFEHTVCVTDYSFPWDALLAELKFHDRTGLAASLSRLLADAVRRSASPAADLVVPVPLSPRRLSERGYNQAWVLAEATAARLGVAARSDLLARPIDTATQHALNRQTRQLNLCGAFMVETQGRAALQGRRVALVDDIMTTGATAVEAAQVLLRAGAKAVDVWAFARTPEH